jgi:predicted membrane-bound mannosyltransferase
MVCDHTRIQRVTLAICLVLAAALLLRIVNLDARPRHLPEGDFITDEGWWAHNARNAFFTVNGG